MTNDKPPRPAAPAAHDATKATDVAPVRELIEHVENDSLTIDWRGKYYELAAELERAQSVVVKQSNQILDLQNSHRLNVLRDVERERDQLKAELKEEHRLSGMSAERELKLMAERDALRAQLAVARDALEGVRPYLKLSQDTTVVPAVYLSPAESLRRAANEMEKKDAAILAFTEALAKLEGKK